MSQPVKIFVSSVQEEFSKERKEIKEAIMKDGFLGSFFEVFIFEENPADNKPPIDVFKDEVKNSDIYVGLFGEKYGSHSDKRKSPTEDEFDLASKQGMYRLVYVKRIDSKTRDVKMKRLIKKAQKVVKTQEFSDGTELIHKLKQSLGDYFGERKLKSTEPYIEQYSSDVTITHLDPDLVQKFVRELPEKSKRDFALAEKDKIEKILSSFKLFGDNQIRRVAILAFGTLKNGFPTELLSAKVKCMAYSGLKKVRPTIDDDNIVGNLGDLIEESLSFVKKNIRVGTGTRDKSMRAPEIPEIPEAVIKEAIVNAVAHRDYESNASVEVMIFHDRLEVFNPALRSAVPDLDSLRGGNSKPYNPTLVSILSKMGYVEEHGTGIPGIFEACHEAGLDEPEISYERDGFVLKVWRKHLASNGNVPIQPPHNHHITPTQPPHNLSIQVKKLIDTISKGEMSSGSIQKRLGLKNRANFLKKYIKPALEAGLIEMTIPEQPNHEDQKYRLTDKGKESIKDT